MLTKISDAISGVISDPIGFVKNWWITVIAAMVLGDALNVNQRISDFLDTVSGGRF